MYFNELKLTGFRGILLVGFGHTMANTCKVATKSGSMINNEPRLSMILDANAQTQPQ